MQWRSSLVSFGPTLEYAVSESSNNLNEQQIPNSYRMTQLNFRNEAVKVREQRLEQNLEELFDYKVVLCLIYRRTMMCKVLQSAN
jgi:hypothetical protein